MKSNCTYLIVIAVVTLFLFHATGHSQEHFPLSDTLRQVDAIVAKPIVQDSVKRKNTAEQLRSTIPDDIQQTVLEKKNDTTTVSMDHSRKNSDTLEDGQSDVNVRLEKIKDDLQKIQNMEGESDKDEEIGILAKSLSKLIDEFETVLGKRTEEPEKESVEIGGVVTVDGGIDPEDVKGSSAEIGQVALSANVYLTPDITASITLLAEGNLGDIAIDEALVEWSPDGMHLNLVFGQHTFNHGLLSTHLISDPAILDYVETALPGLSGQFQKGIITMGLGLGYAHENAVVEDTFYLAGTDIIREEIIRERASDLFTGALNIDADFHEDSKARLSALFMGDAIDVALGVGIVKGGLSLDLEGFVEVKGEENAQPAGYYGGLAYGFTDAIEAAVRYDGLSPDMFSELDHRIGVGMAFGLIHDIFLAVEYGYTIAASGEKNSEITLQLGIESAIQLPGFQRKTLTQD